MTAAEFSNITKTNSVSPICATSNGVIDCSSRRHESPRLCGPPVGRERAPAFLDVSFVLVPEMLERSQNGRDRGVAEGAERFAGDVGRDAREQVEIAHLSFAALDALQDLVQPVGALAAGRALAARLVAKKMQQVLSEPDHAGRVVEHHDGSRAEERARFLNG